MKEEISEYVSKSSKTLFNENNVHYLDLKNQTELNPKTMTRKTREKYSGILRLFYKSKFVNFKLFYHM